jgi:hypothetical protein
MFPYLSSSAWFEVHLAGSGDLHHDARILRQALRPEGHRAWLVCDETGAWFLAVSVHGQAPQRQLEQALRRAGLSGSFVPLTCYPEYRQKV